VVVMTKESPETIDDGLEIKTVVIRGKSYKIREITVEENDAAIDAAKNPPPNDNTINGRVMNRMIVVSALVDPKLDIASIGKLSNKLFSRLFDEINDLNDPEKLETDPNDSAPSSSSEAM
jgi:hypothetical protein